jgi:O-antigen/teichoic acid export membrane protein
LVVLAALPFVTVASGLRGVLEACGRFDWSAAVRVVVGVVTYAGPLAALHLGGGLPEAVGTITAARVVAVLAMTVVTAAALTGRTPSNDRAAALRSLLGGGLWMTVSSLAGAFLAFVDRIVVGRLVSVAAIAYYATPQEVVGRLTLVPAALGAVLFPALSAAATRTGNEAARLFEWGLHWTFAILAPLAAILAAFAPEWLGLWLGPTFAAESQGVVQWFCLSVLYQSLAVTPLSVLQASGRARVTAWLQVAEVPLFVAALWMATNAAGITGAAVVWALRMGATLAAHLLLCGLMVPATASVVREWWTPLALTAVWFAVVATLDEWPARAGLLALGLILLATRRPRLLTSIQRP